ncbi:hypothetical protein L0152_08480, partial [bacterium]|nr:hypothetical protein [bacterium]
MIKANYFFFNSLKIATLVILAISSSNEILIAVPQNYAKVYVTFQNKSRYSWGEHNQPAGLRTNVLYLSRGCRDNQAVVLALDQLLVEAARRQSMGGKRRNP